MCVVIDTCCLANVFNPKDSQHAHFAPILEWVVNGRGRMICGGAKYAAEIRPLHKYVSILAELDRRGKVIRLPDTKVDAIAEALKASVDDSDFNDEHLIAMVIASRCKVVCTHDHVAISYIKRSAFYSCYHVPRPKIYSSNRNQDLCCERYMSELCRR